MSEEKKITLASRLQGFDQLTVWDEFTPMANQYKATNLGQGFPDWESPDFVKEAMVNAVRDNFNQYCRSFGEPSLVNALAEYYSPKVGRNINPLTEVTVSVGATEALFAIMQSFINPGDEVVLIEPAFDIYPAQVQMAGGVSVYVPLRINTQTSKWELNFEELENAITPKTKLLLINTPHNPTGKVFTVEELTIIADIVKRHPHVIVITDEVYENLVYDGKQHARLCTIPGMWDRMLTVSSSGKTFSCTGWKVGWIYGAANLVKGVMMANQWVQFSVSTPTQRALAEVLKKAHDPYEGFENYYAYVNALYERKRNHLAESLRHANITPYVPEGGFFIMADTSNYTVPSEHLLLPGLDGKSPVSRDWAFARWLTKEMGITPIPPSSFYTPTRKNLAENLARFAFCKKDETLEVARVKFDNMRKAVASSDSNDK